ncbi:thioesterase II family protein [Oceanobacillus alkalisoli]|uniref:thioesterase II family protein n=1 Tax=Oceanobacillus alkalisoli TaxID=2925113 RepID=UPI001EF02E43|nr:thioesterase domain-containing protein [Oceanobacillus alkalisoli]MCF3943151.1 thioesterase domain-containing protein [Oceanobacillus alkalisoli]MCG5104729.1 thioesterase domain-containing protein [Oceanobacillus alkalisoli]
MKLYLFPFAGGNSNYYMSWKQRFNSQVEVEPIELSGRGRRIAEPLYSSISEAVQDIYELLRVDQVSTDSPYAFFGHSMGGLIAYELYYKLLENNEKPPVHLFLSGVKPPHLERKRRNITQLTDEELMEEVVNLGGTPQELVDNKELLDYFLPIIRSDFKIVEEYEFKEKGTKVACPISILNGKDDRFDLGEIEQWRNYTDRSAAIHYYSGDHFYLNQNMQELVAYMEHTLAQYEKRNTEITFS